MLAILGAGTFLWAGLDRLSRSDLRARLELSEPLRVLSADGLLMAEFGTERRRPVPIDAVPRHLIDAFLAAEDARFYEHGGVDLRGLARALLRNLQSGERAEGGSTITMQVVRNFLLTPEKSYARKLTEVLMALHLERTLSKDEILALYLNKVFFGHRAYGVGAAAALYYDKQVADLSLAESAMLAGIPKAPSTTNPVTDPERAVARRDHVLARMAALGFVDRSTYRAAVTEPDRARLHQPAVELQAGYAAEMVRRQMLERFGEEAYSRGLRVTTTIDSALQRAAQRAVRDALHGYDRRHGYRGPERRGLIDGQVDAQALDAELDQVEVLPGLRAAVVLETGSRRARLYLGNDGHADLDLAGVRWARPYRGPNRRGAAPRRVSDVLQAGDLVRVRQEPDGHWQLSQRPAVAGALVALSPRDGAVRALVGGYAFGVSQFNRAADARRQPGSAFKPFVYAAALQRGWTPASLILDEPISVRLSRHRVWTPSNFDRRTLGPIRLRTALTHSRNLAAIDLLDRVGIDSARTLAGRLGLERARLPRGLTLALGSGVVSPLALAGAYAAFANGGFRVQPHLIARIDDADGRLVERADPPRACAGCWFRDPDESAPPTGRDGDEAAAERVLEARVAYQMHSMLRDVIRHGTGRRARSLGRSDIAGKTGTTNDVRDAWFCGYQKALVTVAWMGFDDLSPLGRGETGGESALGMWSRFMKSALKDVPEARLPVPAGMVRISVDPATGASASPDRPGAVAEWIREELTDWLAGPDPVYPDGLGVVDGGDDSIIEQVY
jgi:penicillin-binding protein 1A